MSGATSILRRLARRPADERPAVAFFHEFVKAPWGGGNQFLLALRRELDTRGLRTEANRVDAGTRACLFNSHTFDARRLERARREGVRMVHRVDGPISVYRGHDDGTDERIAAANAALADRTVFQSSYSLERHRALGFELVSPTVIPNAPDPAIFHARGRAPLVAGERVRVITTSWSDNPHKGAATVAWLAAQLDPARYELTFVGRAQVELPAAVRTLPPLPSEEVADLLRAHHVFFFPSLHEACSNALLEAMACGLPAVAADSGSNNELLGDGGLLFAEREEVPALVERVAAEWEDRRARLAPPRLSDVADRYLDVLGVGT